MNETRQTDPESGFMLITPTHRLLNAGTTYCVELAHQLGVPFIWKLYPGDALIGRVRSIAATWVLEHSPFNYAIFLDSDIVFTPDDLLRLFRRLRDEHYELIGGVYTVRSAKQLAHYVKGSLRLDGTVREVDYLSTGFMGFSKTTLDKVRLANDLPLCHADAPMFRCYPFFENTAQRFEGQWIYESEDWDFCRKARKAGIRPMVDTGIRLGHEGFKVWGVNDMAPDVCRVEPAVTKLHLPGQPGRKAARDTRSRLALPR